MFARLAAVVQDVGVVAASVFEGVGKDGETIKVMPSGLLPLVSDEVELGTFLGLELRGMALAA